MIAEDQGCGSLCSVAMEQLGKQLSTVIWKGENICDELVVLMKETSKQYVENIC